jgi:predicted nucleic acid-binding protein
LARVVLDTGAVIALSRREARVRAFLERARRNRDLVIVPAVVVAETTRGGPRDAPVNQVLKAIDEIAPVLENTARTAGRLLAASSLSGATVDALVVAEAVLGGPSIVLTGDFDDLSTHAGDHRQVHIYDISHG